MDDKSLTRIFADAGARYNYEKATAEFCGYADFKVRWQRTWRQIDLHISDYLDEAPTPVMEALADTLFQRIMGVGPAPDEPIYPKAMLEYITSQEFRDLKRHIWTERMHAVGSDSALEKVSRVLAEMGEDVEDLRVCTGPKVCMSALFRTVVIPEDTPRSEIKSCVRRLLDAMESFKS